jgi:TetR/AcrR family transcriptional regulator, ethionamide resistance regulator
VFHGTYTVSQTHDQDPTAPARLGAVTIDQEEIDARRHEARKREIVERVLPVVEQKVVEAGSYANLRVEDILRDAVLSRSTFYRYFKDKNELLLALGEPVFADVRAAAIRPWDRSTAPSRDELRAELRRNFDIYLPHVPVICAMVEASYYSPTVRELFEQGFAEVQRSIAGHIAQGQRAGFVRPDVLADETAAWITWMAERGMTQIAATADDAALDRLAESLATMVWCTVYEVR